MRSTLLPAPTLLHIPDGFLSLAVSLICWALALVGVGLALVRSRDKLGERQIPLMGVLAAYVFAAQMLNFTVAGGTSGHLVGGALTAILLGPWASILVMTTVVGVQALLFQDGGVLAMGANILDMGIITTLVAYGVYHGVRLLLGQRRWAVLASGFIAAWVSIVTSATAVAVQLGFSGTSPIGLALPAMVGVHVLIGIGEGLITMGALALISTVRSDLVSTQSRTSGGLRWTLVGLAMALVLTILSPLASPHPDGLERIAADLGFDTLAQDAPYELISDYSLPGVSNESLSTVAAGVVGTIIVFGIFASGAALYRRRTPSEI